MQVMEKKKGKGKEKVTPESKTDPVTRGEKFLVDTGPHRDLQQEKETNK